jgi:membrane protein implicated in regulation of membrane protease activity
MVLVSKAIAVMISEQSTFKNYWGGVVFAPFVLVVILLSWFAVLNMLNRKKGKEPKSKHDGIFEGPLKDWKKW